MSKLHFEVLNSHSGQKTEIQAEEMRFGTRASTSLVVVVGTTSVRISICLFAAFTFEVFLITTQ